MRYKISDCYISLREPKIGTDGIDIPLRDDEALESV